ncbi:MAG: [NiFe]-hydrogenase assembly chaperone HybE [Woeseia sp.]
MIKESDDVAALLRHFENIEREHMRGLPIVNSKLAVEVIGVRQFGEHRICILIAPWFMNLVLLPGNDDWAGVEQGQVSEIGLPRETLEFTVCHDDIIGTFLTAVMFRTVSDFPDQDTARNIAIEILEQLFTQPDRPVLSRRALLTGAAAGDA